MPSHKDQLGSDDFPPTITDQLNQLIQISTTAANPQTDIKNTLAAHVEATSNLNTELDGQTDNTACLVNHITQLTDQIASGPSNLDSTNLGPKPAQQYPPNTPLAWIFQAEKYYTYY
ncbi:hypothetical protein HanRHA438_Chr07g0293811 [Helianthus annuus]|nr:hypothetical protein HanRHA438_Chr07g0293811 [Helianthus annuus]